METNIYLGAEQFRRLSQGQEQGHEGGGLCIRDSYRGMRKGMLGRLVGCFLGACIED